MTENARLQRLAERIQEDERLRGDLEDDLASALIAWAIERVEAAAADPARPDSEVELEVQAIRAAAQAAARSGESDSQRLIALAEAGLAQRLGKATASAPTADVPPPAVSAPTPGTLPPAPAVAMSVPVAEQQRPEVPQAPPADHPGPPADKPGPPVRKRRRNRIANWLKRKRGGR